MSTINFPRVKQGPVSGPKKNTSFKKICLVKSLVLLPIFSLWITGCSEDKKDSKPKPPPQLIGVDIAGNPTSVGTILDKNEKGIAKALIMIGETQDSPFKGNVFRANDNGQFNIPVEWTTAQTITIDAPGYVRATYLMREPKELTFHLKSLPTTTLYELKGRTTGHSIKNGDDFVDFGVIIPAMTKKDLLNFNLKSIFSTQMDSFSIIGLIDVKVPGNVTLPTQTESYFFVPFTIEKPEYHIQFPELGLRKLFALSGRVPFARLVDEIRNKTPFINLVNLFEFKSGNFAEVNIVDGVNKQDLSVTGINFVKDKKVHAPVLNGDEFMMAVGISEVDKYLIPTDMKQLKSNETAHMASVPQKDSHMLTVLKRQSEMKSGMDRVSAALNYSFLDNTTPEFLPLIENPKVISPEEIQLPDIQPVGSVKPIANVITLSSVTTTQIDKDNISKSMKLVWEIYSPSWLKKFHLPSLPPPPALDGGPGTTKRWDVTFMGTTKPKIEEDWAILGNEVNLYDNATHLTHSSVEY